jgi:hypothetical protein
MTTTPPTDSELFKLSREYLDKLEKMTEKVTKAITNLSDIKKELDDAKRKYTMRNVILDWLKTLLPLIILILIFVGVQSMPCGTNIEMGLANIKRTCEGQTVSVSP